MKGMEERKKEDRDAHRQGIEGWGDEKEEEAKQPVVPEVLLTILSELPFFSWFILITKMVTSAGGQR